MNNFILSFFFIVIVNNLFAQNNYFGINPNTKNAPQEHNFDFTHIIITPTFDLKQGKVSGSVTHYFQPLLEGQDSMYLHAKSITIEKVIYHNQNIEYKSSDSSVVILFKNKLPIHRIDSITITYSCFPRKGIYFIGWNDTTGRNRRQIWTQGEGEDNRHWIPMYDKPNDKMITEMIIEFDNKYKVLSNGTQINVSPIGNGMTRWHYRMQYPHSTYLIMLGIGEYEIETRNTKAGIPVNLYYYPDHKDRVAWSYKYSTECIDFMVQETGMPYPWESYSQIPVQDFMYGAMENTTATIFGDFFMTDERAFNDKNYIGVNVHELTHQWFGDLITNRNWDHIWLQESFATFYPKLFQRMIYGEDHYQWMRRQEQNAALSASESNKLPIVHMDSGTERVYSKGSAVIDMMRYIWGEKTFKQVIKHFLLNKSYQNVETNDFIQAFQDAAGISPQWFFDQWIYGGGEPAYQATYQEVMKEAMFETQITVKQTHQRNAEVGLFNMPVLLEVWYRDGSHDSHKVWISKETENIIIPNDENKTIDFVLFDPGSYIIKKIDFIKSEEELLNQVQRAKNMIDRYDALIQLRKTKIEKKREILNSIYTKEKYKEMRAEIISQLLLDDQNNEITQKTILTAFEDSAANVRNIVLQGADAKLFLTQFERLLHDKSYLNIALALEKLLYTYPEKSKTYLELTKNYINIGHRNRIKWLELAILYDSNNKIYLKELLDYTSPSFDFNTQRNAAEILKKLNYLDEVLIKNLTECTFSGNNRLAGPIKEIIKYYCSQSAYKSLFHVYWNDQEWTPWQQNIINTLMKY